MEQKIIILIDNQKYFEPKKKPFLDEIRKFIKKEYNLPKESIIEIYNNDFSKRIYSGSDLEKLKEKNEQFNEYIIRINYKVKEMQNLHNSMTKEKKFIFINIVIIILKITIKLIILIISKSIILILIKIIILIK